MSIETSSQTTGRRGDDDFGTPPQSRVEMALMKETIKPQSRIEKLLLEGGGGTSNVQGIHLEINPLTFVMTMWLIDGDGEQVGTAQSIDLPIEATVVGMSYDDSTRTLILTLVSGATLSVPIGAIIYGLQPLIDSTHKLSASLVDDTQGRMRFTWVGTQAQYAIDSATMAAGTPVIITDDTDIDTTPTQGSDNPVTSGGVFNSLARLDTTTGDIYFGQTRVARVMDYNSYAALTAKESIYYLTYPTPTQNSGRSLQTSPLTKNENSEGEEVKETEPETKKSVEMEISDEQLKKLPPFGFGGYDE